jgi:uncharacterized membrane protein
MRRTQGEYRRYDESSSSIEQLAAGLGWFSIGLGLAEVAAPGTVARLIGVRDTDRTRNLFRAYGAREIANGAAILGGGAHAPWLWARVGGDIVDIATLTGELNDERSDRNRLLAAIGAVAGVTALDAFCAMRLRGNGTTYRAAGFRPEARRTGTVHVQKSLTINKQPDVVYGFWRKLENLPKFMRHLESVQQLDETRSRWRAKAPAGLHVEWDAEIIDDQPNERISWRSIEGASVPNRGTVTFRPAPGARGTEIHVDMEYSVPGGRFSAAIAKLFGREPEQQVADDLRRLKQVLEAGEIARSGGSASYRQPAQPAPELLRKQMQSEGVRR